MLEATRTLGKRDGTWSSGKRLMIVRGSDVPGTDTSCKGDDAEDEIAALLSGGGDDEDVGVDHLECFTNETSR